MGRLENKVMVISGAGSGIGQGTALLAAKEGAKLVLVDVSDRGAQETLDEVRKVGGEAIYVRTDVSDEDSVKNLYDEAVKAFGQIDVLFNCAGIAQPPGNRRVIDLDQSVWDRVVDVNMKGTYLMCKHGIPHLIAAGGGSIINVGSAAAVVGSRGVGAAYTASKGGIISMTRLLAAEVARKQVRVNCICPGPIRTNMTATEQDQYQTTTPIGRVGLPEDIGHAAIFLASDEASFITAAILSVDGGRSAIAGYR